MGILGRRNREQPISDELGDDLGDGVGDGLGGDPALDITYDDHIDDSVPTGTVDGPYDVIDLPDDSVPRIDLGSLRVPAPPEGELRLEMNDGQEVVAAAYVTPRSGLQLTVFAAPRSEGIWADVRDEMLAGIKEAGGVAEVVDGPFGSELKARVPETPGKKTNLQPARFVGIDGPRWFLRGMFTGQAATDRAAAAPLEKLLRGVVVVRGTDAMAPRDQLAMSLPREAQEAVEDAGGPAAPRRLPQPVRGPEITEIQ